MMETIDKRSIILPNRVEVIDRLATFVEEVAESHGIDGSVAMSINLALKEAVVNVMNYAYPKGTTGDLKVESSFSGDTLSFTVSDSGTPFDPTKMPDPDTTLSVEERPIGGLGIFLVRQIMDEVSYRYEDKRNILTMKKKI